MHVCVLDQRCSYTLNKCQSNSTILVGPDDHLVCMGVSQLSRIGMLDFNTAYTFLLEGNKMRPEVSESSVFSSPYWEHACSAELNMHVYGGCKTKWAFGWQLFKVYGHLNSHRDWGLVMNCPEYKNTFLISLFHSQQFWAAYRSWLFPVQLYIHRRL